ncbi:MAG: Cytochrome c1 [Alphaproteobacteria bacterium MarineAlpha5_Bin11]|nr:MAG: Cytochrome c1 [Alphaproteobacteria bacterium MarineAlpha5_Bin11]PPR50475.1 MAG: Cytochrome c1 [Alphaproteobacteria bacterium MarineAlpha5_Bin10]|tara:strand:- start:9960 stop:10721 length:762 start_codon:yes stop_codon:yes gene_type:complete
MMNKLLFTLFALIIINSSLQAEELKAEKLKKQDWSFEGITGTFDRASIQRGFKVYREVCAVCHSMNLLYYRDLIDIGFSPDQIKVIASEYTVIDGPNDEGEMFERPARPSDRFVDPYRNDVEARLSNNGAYPPDLSLITKSRKGGADYLYNLLTGYAETEEGSDIGEGMYYNLYMPGNQIAMPQPLYDESVEYDDGTPNNLNQLSYDLTNFLVWAAEPELEERKRIGIMAILFFVVFGVFSFFLKLRLWKKVS